MDLFSKGVDPWFWSKNGPLFFRQRRPGKYLLPYSKTEKRLCRVYKEEVQKVEKLTFFQSMVLVQKWPFFFFFLGNIGQEVEFSDILELKNVSLSYKNKTLKKSKNGDLLKGVWF